MSEYRYAPAPRFITPRTPGSRTEGLEIARLAKAMGRPGMPHQKCIWNGATELTDEGFYRYKRVLITLPRQSGKTVLYGPVQLHRIMKRAGIKAFFTAQTGKDAHARTLDLIKFATESPLAPLFHPRYAAGSAGITTPNGSQLREFAPSPSAIHGETPHLVGLDEIWALSGAQGGAIMGGIGPAQATLEGESQVWMFSTMGTSQSDFMNPLVELGRSGTAKDLFYAEWSLEPGLDPYDPQSWWTFHPALGNTISVGHLQAEATKALDPADETMSHGEWMRAYMNVVTTALDPIIPAEDWDKLAGDQERPAWSDIAVTYDVALENESGSVMAFWRDAKGRPNLHVIHTAPGTAWMVPLLATIWRQHRPKLMSADDGGPTRRITDELRRTLDDSWPARLTNGREFGIACENLLVEARDLKTLVQDGSKTLSNAVAHAVLRKTNGVTTINRTESTGHVHGLIAGAVGMFMYDHHDGPGEALQIH